jgi:hypothetical protein
VHNANYKQSTGKWEDVNESMSSNSRDYQEKITGHRNQAWVENGVKFDGYSDGRLIDTKAHYGDFVDSSTGQFKDWFSGKNELVNQANRQIQAANGIPIDWYFQESAAMNATQMLFNQNGITGIRFIFMP